MENKLSTQTKKSVLNLSTIQDFSKLTKEQLMTLVSNLQDMPIELAMRLSEHIPEYLGVCKETLEKVVSMYSDSKESADRNAQKVMEAFDSRRKMLEKGFSEAKTDADKKYYVDETKKLDKEQQDFCVKIEKEQEKRNKSFIKSLLPVLAFIAAGVGISVQIGKRLR